MTSFSESFPATYRRFLPSVRAKSRRLLGHVGEADEVAHEVFVRMWQSPPEFDPTDARSVGAWLYRTCTRLSIDVLRRRRVAEFRPIDDDEDSALPCGQWVEAQAAARKLIALVAARAPADALEAAILCRVDGLSQPEAAEVLGASERTVRRLLERFDEVAAPWRKELLS